MEIKEFIVLKDEFAFYFGFDLFFELTGDDATMTSLDGSLIG